MDSSKSTRTLTLPRGLIVLACLWIAFSWLILFGVDPPVQAVATSYSDSVTMMTISTILGISIGWPLLRTSGRRFTLPLRQTLLDMIVLACAVQVITWPLRLVSTWSVTHTVLISAAICAWLIPFGAIVRFGASTRSTVVRSCAMGLALILVVAGGLLANTDMDPWWSPLDSVISRARRQPSVLTMNSAGGIVAVAIAGIGLWILLSGIRIALEQSGHSDSERVNSA